jgi:hypothetical protein
MRNLGDVLVTSHARHGSRVNAPLELLLRDVKRAHLPIASRHCESFLAESFLAMAAETCLVAERIVGRRRLRVSHARLRQPQEARNHRRTDGRSARGYAPQYIGFVRARRVDRKRLVATADDLDGRYRADTGFSISRGGARRRLPHVPHVRVL